MEEHFSNNNTCYEKYTSLQKADISFFKNSFGLVPIFNVGTERNIIRYHIINKFKFFGILLFLTLRLLRKMKNFRFRLNFKIFKELFTGEERSVLRKLLKNNNNYISFMHSKYSINESQRTFTSKKKFENDIMPNYDESKAYKYSRPSLLTKYFWK